MNAHDPDLDWLAQQYLLGELDGAAAARFEAAVARDDAAAAALADAMRLMAVLDSFRAAGPAPAVAVPPARLQRWTATHRGVLAAALAASLALVWVALRIPAGAAARDRDRAVELLAGWQEAGSDDDADEAAEEETGTDDEVPAWLLAAVAIEPDMDGTVPLEN